nr:glycoside hydrolase family 15 protein [Nocardia sp. BMG111209]
MRGYAFLADGRRGALVGPRGDIAWMCLPGWDGDAVFAGLLGAPSTYAVVPARTFVWGGSYEEGTLIWRSRWVAGSALIECREALAYPGDPHRAVLLRRIVAVREDAEVDVLLRPVADFGADPVREPHRDAAGVWRARVGPWRLRWTGAPDATVDGDGGWTARIRLRAGQSHDLVLEMSDRPLPDEPVDVEHTWAATESVWLAQQPDLGNSIAPRDAGHAYAVLRGMTSEGGGMVAAATTSLPERADQGENYDYRYVWIRDQCIAGQSVAALGPYPLLDDAVAFVTERLLADGPGLAPAYTTAGAPVPPTRTLDLPGYPGARPMIGNRVSEQFQLDIFGEALLLFAVAGRYDRLSPDHRRAARIAAAAIGRYHDRPDAGIWELENRFWTHSRLSCIAGLRAAAECPATGVDAGACTALAGTLLADVNRDGTHPRGFWQRGPGLPGADSALLLPIVRGAMPIEDPRCLATFEEIRAQLCDDHYVYRFRHGDTPLPKAEGAFLLCGFAMAMAAAQLGLPVTAARFFERNRAACGTPGLFAEEFDVEQRQLRGNLPQAFVHALLLESSVLLSADG